MKKILIIEDVEFNRDLLTQLLEDDFELIAVSDGQDDRALAEQGLLAARVKLLALTGQLPGVSPDGSIGATAAVASAQ